MNMNMDRIGLDWMKGGESLQLALADGAEAFAEEFVDFDGAAGCAGFSWGDWVCLCSGGDAALGSIAARATGAGAGTGTVAVAGTRVPLQLNLLHNRLGVGHNAGTRK